MRHEGVTKEEKELANSIALSVAKIAAKYNEMAGIIEIEVGDEGEEASFILKLEYEFVKNSKDT